VAGDVLKLSTATKPAMVPPSTRGARFIADSPSCRTRDVSSSPSVGEHFEVNTLSLCT
jgi:hypothetical protein